MGVRPRPLPGSSSWWPLSAQDSPRQGTVPWHDNHLRPYSDVGEGCREDRSRSHHHESRSFQPAPQRQGGGRLRVPQRWQGREGVEDTGQLSLRCELKPYRRQVLASLRGQLVQERLGQRDARFLSKPYYRLDVNVARGGEAVQP